MNSSPFHFARRFRWRRASLQAYISDDIPANRVARASPVTKPARGEEVAKNSSRTGRRELYSCRFSDLLEIRAAASLVGSRRRIRGCVKLPNSAAIVRLPLERPLSQVWKQPR